MTQTESDKLQIESLCLRVSAQAKLLDERDTRIAELEAENLQQGLEIAELRPMAAFRELYEDKYKQMKAERDAALHSLAHNNGAQVVLAQRNEDFLRTNMIEAQRQRDAANKRAAQAEADPRAVTD